jgi:N-acetylmuramoyl-L-alanine amidase
LNKKHIIPQSYHLVILCALIVLAACGEIRERRRITYTGNLDFTQHSWLQGKKIFIDPGHGGMGAKDTFRIGPTGLTEEKANLDVALFLAFMLEQAGVEVRLSRESDTAVSLDERAAMARQYGPDLFISIHHNGTIRAKDGVNYPAILFWGNKELKPLSYQYAEILLKELEEIMHKKGHVISDYTIFWESGSRVLRKTNTLCPGVLGEAGFFSDPDQEQLLKTEAYIQREAEAYFLAISKFFKPGIPSLQLYASSMGSRHPRLAIKVSNSNEEITIPAGSLNVSINNLKVRTVRMGKNLYRITYGRKLYPGLHRIRFSCKNSAGRSSMRYSSNYLVIPRKGEFARLLRRGVTLIESGKEARQGLQILLPLLHLAISDPSADKIHYYIARGFMQINDRRNAAYYFKRLYHFFPQSSFRKKIEQPAYKNYHFPVDYYGTYSEIIHEADFTRLISP